MVTKKVAKAIWKWGPEVESFLTNSRGKVIGYLKHGGEVAVFLSPSLGRDFETLMPHIPLKPYDEFDNERYMKQKKAFEKELDKWKDKKAEGK